MRRALFHNFTDKDFVGYWNGKPYTFKPGYKKEMNAPIAAHFAKHLTNRELLAQGMENYTSPKKPQDVPEFMNLFNKAFIMNENEPEVDEIGLVSDDASAPKGPSMNIEKAPRQEIDPYDANAQPQVGSGPSTVIAPPAGDPDGDDFEEAPKPEDADPLA